MGTGVTVGVSVGITGNVWVGDSGTRDGVIVAGGGGVVGGRHAANNVTKTIPLIDNLVLLIGPTLSRVD
jgi:hypothetical protein